MSLYIRLQTSFWTHRKTIRLRARIGDAALWVLPRLWSYAADNQPDGDFTNYSAPEIAMLLGYTSDAQALLVALQETGWLDGMEIHDWEEFNGYHQSFSDRAKKAAKARWKGQEKTRKERTRKDKSQAMLDDATSIATSIFPQSLDNQTFKDAWDRWSEYRKQARLKQYTDIGAGAQLKKLAELGAARAVSAIENSIANAYQGIFEPKENAAKSKTQPTPAENDKYRKQYGW